LTVPIRRVKKASDLRAAKAAAFDKSALERASVSAVKLLRYTIIEFAVD
jgi:hypothetical protein